LACRCLVRVLWQHADKHGGRTVRARETLGQELHVENTVRAS
jgi:hypothetical protein